MSSLDPLEVRAAAAARSPKQVVPPGPAGDTVRLVRILELDVAKQTEAIEQLFRNADDVTICGVAGPAIINALTNFAIASARPDASLPWGRLRYVTPEPSLALATRSEQQLGPVVRPWLSALAAVRNCIRIDLRPEQPVGAGILDQVQLFATPALYTEAILRVVKNGRSEIWATIGPHLATSGWDASVGPEATKIDTAYLVLGNEDPLYRSLNSRVDRLLQSAKPYPLRQVTCACIDEEGLELLSAAAPVDPSAGLEVDGMRLSEEARRYPRACMPIAATVVRAMSHRGPVVLLRKRDPGRNSDSFDRLALLSSRIYEEDVASALGVPPFFDHVEEEALARMWHTADIDGPLRVSLGSFVRAAQRDIYTSLGLDIPLSRFRLCGFQTLEHESGDQNFFAIFELVLEPHRELPVAVSDLNQFKQIRQTELYTEHRGQLNHLIEQRREWLSECVLSHPLQRNW